MQSAYTILQQQSHHFLGGPQILELAKITVLIVTLYWLHRRLFEKHILHKRSIYIVLFPHRLAASCTLPETTHYINKRNTAQEYFSGGCATQPTRRKQMAYQQSR